MTHSKKQGKKCPKCKGKGKLELEDESGNKFEIPCPECWNRGHKIKANKRSTSRNPLISRGTRRRSGRGGRGKASAPAGAAGKSFEKVYEGEIHPTLGESYEPTLDPEESGTGIFEPLGPDEEPEVEWILDLQRPVPDGDQILNLEIDDSFAPGLEIEQGQEAPLQPDGGYEIQALSDPGAGYGTSLDLGYPVPALGFELADPIVEPRNIYQDPLVVDPLSDDPTLGYEGPETLL